MLLVLSLVAVACAPRGGNGPAAETAKPASTLAVASPGIVGAIGAENPVPVDADTPRWGDDAAPVTLVEFSDLQCPFCARVQPTLAALQQRYGPHQLRVVFRHDPLPFHRNAGSAALAAEAVRRLGGNDAFFRFIGLLFADQGHLEPADLHRAALAAGVNGASFELLARSSQVRERVEADLELSSRVGANGTPHFLINGAVVSGAVPLDDFVSVIDRELAEARALTAGGTPPANVYAIRTKTNFKPPEAQTAEPEEEKPFRVPVGTSPRLGPDDALVTIIEFSDFECPFCKRVQPTIDAVRARYGNDVRLIWKHLPLPFHKHARAAATFSIEARKALGDAGFWKACAALLDSSPNLDDAALAGIAKSLGLDWTQIHRAIEGNADDAVLTEDEATSIDFEARGTPHFFINGRRLVGAQPLEVFTATIDAELDRAKKLVASGIPRAKVFDELMRSASGPPAPEQRPIPAPTAANPSRGPAAAKVTIQMFADFE